MSESPFKLLNTNRDAVATNRGFYFQYLSLLNKWINNFVNKNNNDLYTEVGDDIQEVGNKVIFTQLKCYTGPFSLTSPEIKTALLNYFVLYMDRLQDKQPAMFVFETNTTIAPRDRLLQKWKINGLLGPPNIQEECTKVIKKLLTAEVKKIRDRKLNHVTKTDGDKLALKEQFRPMFESINDEHIGSFIKLIVWNFGEISPDAAIAKLTQDILNSLTHHEFQGRSPRLLMEVFLSEIYRVSQHSEKKERILNSTTIKNLIQKNDEELNKYVDSRVLKIMDFRFTELFQNIEDIKQIQLEQITVQQNHRALIDQLNETVEQFTVQKPLQRFLTPIPAIANMNLIERPEALDELGTIINTHRHVAIQGPGGMGKSTLAKQFVHHENNNYDHLIWFNVDTTILSAIVTNTHLLMALPKSIMEQASDDQRFAAVTNYLLTIPGKNLLIINDYKGEQEKLEQLKGLPNWDILLTTRLMVPDTKLYIIGQLSLSDSKKLYCKLLPDAVEPEEKVFTKFLKLIGNNILMVELVAKAIANGLDLTLVKIVELYENQQLDDEDLDIDVYIADRAGSVRLFEYLKQTFNLDDLEVHDRFLCLLLSLLPAEDTLLSELIEWGGKKSEQVNKKNFINACNRLHTLGLINRSGNNIRMNRLLQEAIIYQERAMKNPFMSLAFQFAFLRARLQEGIASDPQKALRFLKYAESILNNIKESFRAHVRQPLITIENEALMILNWLKPAEEMKERWRALAISAEKHLNKSDPLLSVIASNCGMAYHTVEDLDTAEIYYKKAISGMKSLEQIPLPQLLTALGNLSLLFVNKGDFESFRPVFDEAAALRTKYKMWSDKTVPVHAYVLAMANLKAENLKTAIELFKVAIKTHKELPVFEQDDTLLSGYLANLSAACFFFGDAEKANFYINETVSVLTKVTIADKNRWEQSANMILSLAKEIIDESSWKSMKNDLDKAHNRLTAQPY